MENDIGFGIQTCEISIPDGADIAEFQENLRKKLGSRRDAIFDVLLRDCLAQPQIRILEIGVFKADNVQYAMTHFPNIVEYSGIDDYGQSEGSTYVSATSYWKTQEDADAQHEKSKQIFEKFGQKLFRMTSDEFLETDEALKKYDVVFVDGNHSYEFALRDMKSFFGSVQVGGIMLVDDYDNPQHPGVTKAAARFIRENLKSIDKIRGIKFYFANVNVLFPISQTVLAIFKK